MKKALSVYLPNGKQDDYREGDGGVKSIRLLNTGVVSVMYEELEGETVVRMETLYSGMPFILSDV